MELWVARSMFFQNIDKEPSSYKAQGGGGVDVLEIFSNFNDSMILWKLTKIENYSYQV